MLLYGTVSRQPSNTGVDQTSLLAKGYISLSNCKGTPMWRVQVLSPECISKFIMGKYTIQDCSGPEKAFVSCLAG